MKLVKILMDALIAKHNKAINVAQAFALRYAEIDSFLTKNAKISIRSQMMDALIAKLTQNGSA